MADTRLNEDITEGLRAGNLEVRLAGNEAEVDAAQNLRYRVFYEEMIAAPGTATSTGSTRFAITCWFLTTTITGAAGTAPWSAPTACCGARWR